MVKTVQLCRLNPQTWVYAQKIAHHRGHTILFKDGVCTELSASDSALVGVPKSQSSSDSKGYVEYLGIVVSPVKSSKHLETCLVNIRHTFAATFTKKLNIAAEKELRGREIFEAIKKT